MANGTLNFGFNIATEAKIFTFPLTLNTSQGITVVDFNYWTKMTLTYTTKLTYPTNQSVSHTKVYFNGTSLNNFNSTGVGKVLRFQESSTLLLGKYGQYVCSC